MFFLSEDDRLDTIRPGTVIYRKNPRREYLAENVRIVCTPERSLAQATQINTQSAFIMTYMYIVLQLPRCDDIRE